MTASVASQEVFLDLLFSIIYSTYTIIGVILNVFVLCLIVTQKHYCIKEYRILLGNSTCSLLLLSLLAFFLQLRFVTAGDSLGYVALGPARFLSMPRLVLFCTALMLAIDIYAFMTIAMCMVYKFTTISGNNPSEKQLLFSIATFFLLPLSTGIALLIYNPDFTELHTTLNFLRPEYELQRYGDYSGLPNVKNIYVMYLIVVICGIGFSSYIVMITVGIKMKRFLKKRGVVMSSKSTRIFNMMVKALIIQSFMPVLFSFPTKILYMFLQFTSFRSLTAEYLVFAISPLVSVIDPCITLYYVLPYRRCLTRKLFPKKIRELQPSTMDPEERSWITSTRRSARYMGQKQSTYDM